MIFSKQNPDSAGFLIFMSWVAWIVFAHDVDAFL